MARKKKVYYYRDEVNDDFAAVNQKINRKSVDEKFRYYNPSPIGRAIKFLIYRVIVTPIVCAYLKVACRVKYVNLKAAKEFARQKRPCFIYGNHTGYACDAFNPTKIAYPREAYVIVNADTTSIPGLRHLLLNIGALPIPEDFHYMNRFNDAMDRAVKRNAWIAVYPEAHIWPWYTEIRPFPKVSFRYPVKYGTPVFSFTMTYQKGHFFNIPKRTVYIDGPFYPDSTLSVKEAEQKLRDEVYAAMCREAEHSDYSYAEYVRMDPGTSTDAGEDAGEREKGYPTGEAGTGKTEGK